MIRFYDGGDLAEMSALWSEAFGDSDDYIDFFFRQRLPQCDALVVEDSRKIISQLFLMPGNFRAAGKLFSTQYIYAAATLPEYRGMGHMAQLIEFAKKSALARGIDFLALVPGEQWLYNYYSRFGFVKAFTYKKTELSRSLLRSKSAFRAVISSPLFQNPAELYAAPTGDRFVWDEDAVKYALAEHERGGGDVIYTDGAWALSEQQGAEVYVSELCTNKQSFPWVGAKLLSYYNADKFIFRIPEDAFLAGEKSKVFSGGMLCPLTKSAFDGLKSSKCAYIGLALE